jgi:hypothetical protein
MASDGTDDRDRWSDDEPVDWGRLGKEIAADFEQTVLARRGDGSSSVSEVAQDVVGELYERSRSKGDLPKTHRLMKELAAGTLSRRWRSSRKRERDRQRLCKRYLAERPEHPIEAICNLDEARKLLVAIFAALEADERAQKCLYCILKYDVPYHDNKLISKLVGCPVVQVNNAKRRIRRVAGATAAKRIGLLSTRNIDAAAKDQ